MDRSWAHCLAGLLALGATVVLAGCSLGNYRIVKKQPTAGEVALVGVQSEAREKAEGYMRGHCPSGYDVLEEGETVVGQQHIAQSETRPRSSVFGPSMQTQTRAETVDKREWRIKYQCKGQSPAAAPMPTGTQGKIYELVVRF